MYVSIYVFIYSSVCPFICIYLMDCASPRHRAWVVGSFIVGLTGNDGQNAIPISFVRTVVCNCVNNGFTQKPIRANVCMCVYMCVVYVSISVYVYVCVLVSVSACVHVPLCKCIYTCVFMSVCGCVCMCIYVCVYVCVCVSESVSV